jgi:tetratricopeptide (TPR) repeat protein
MRACAWAFLVFLVTARASAQPADPRAGAAPNPERLFEESAQHYRAGRFDKAIELLQEAHRLSGEPVLLFNLAKAYEGRGDLEAAIAAYERYLRDARDIPDRGAIARRIETLRAAVATRRALERDVEAQRLRAEKAMRERPGPRPAPWIIAGVGAAGVAAGGILGALAKSKEADAVAEREQRSAAGLRDEAQTRATVANVAFAVGGAMVLGGATWGIVDVVLATRDTKPAARLQVGPSQVSLVVSFPQPSQRRPSGR